jgi:phosphoglycolate phosphatase
MNHLNQVFKAVLFDLDGTLINSLMDIADSMNRVLVQKGYKIHEYDAYRDFIGKGLRNLVINTLPDASRTEQNITNLLQELLQDYEQHLLHKTALYKGIPELLNALSGKHIKMCILSNKADPFTQTIKATLLSDWQFEVVLGASNAFPRKPNPDAAWHICKTIGLPPNEVLFVGDSSVDMETAKAAGMYPVGVTWGFRTRDELIDSGAKKLIDSPLGLLKCWD